MLICLWISSNSGLHVQTSISNLRPWRTLEFCLRCDPYTSANFAHIDHELPGNLPSPWNLGKLLEVLDPSSAFRLGIMCYVGYSVVVRASKLSMNEFVTSFRWVFSERFNVCTFFVLKLFLFFPFCFRTTADWICTFKLDLDLTFGSYTSERKSSDDQESR